MKKKISKKVLASALLFGIGALCVADTNRPSVFDLVQARESSLRGQMVWGQDQPCPQVKPDLASSSPSPIGDTLEWVHLDTVLGFGSILY